MKCSERTFWKKERGTIEASQLQRCSAASCYIVLHKEMAVEQQRNGQLRQRRTANAASPKSNTVDDSHAEEEHLEFGGAVGTFAMMTGFPALFYYLYVCLYFYDGQSRVVAKM